MPAEELDGCDEIREGNPPSTTDNIVDEICNKLMKGDGNPDKRVNLYVVGAIRDIDAEESEQDVTPECGFTYEKPE